MVRDMDVYNKVIKHYKQITLINHITGLLDWDMNVNLPPHGYESRGEQMAYCAKTKHLLLIDEKFNDLIDELQGDTSLSERMKSEISFIKHKVEIQKKIPVALVEELAILSSIATGKWEQAKETGDDSDYLPVLNTIFTLTREYAQCKGFVNDPYNALLDDYDRGLTYSIVESLFSTVKEKTLTILNTRKIENNNYNWEDVSVANQKIISDRIIDFLGIDRNKLILSESTHPFTATVGNGDVRITTAYTENDFLSSIYSTLHEAGHALYELGVHKEFGDSPCGDIVSLSLHESQSRFYENCIGRSRSFIEFFFPIIKEVCNDQFASISVDQFYAAVNKISDTPIRIESDEINYNLHIILRTKIERDLINKTIDVTDINEIWNKEFYDMFNKKIIDKRSGYLQDIHWAGGGIGYFPTYTMGNIIATQFAKLLNDETGVLNKPFSKQSFTTISGWFQNRLYRYGNTLTSFDLVTKVTGNAIDPLPLIHYLSR